MSDTFTVPPAIQMRRNMAAARELLHANPAFRVGRPVCPAGKPVAETSRGKACRCVIEQATIAEGTEPVSLNDFCFGNYRACTTWRAEQARVAEGRRKFLIEEAGGQRHDRHLRELGDDTFVMDGPREGRDEAARG